MYWKLIRGVEVCRKNCDPWSLYMSLIFTYDLWVSFYLSCTLRIQKRQILNRRLFDSRFTAMRISICFSPDYRWWALNPHHCTWLGVVSLDQVSILSCALSPPCRITMESHSLAPLPLCRAETGASPTTPTQVGALWVIIGHIKPHQTHPYLWHRGWT